MITEERAIQRLERANPRPHSAQTIESLGGAGYLAVIKTRSKEMQTMDIERETDSQKRPPTWGWFALAAAVIAIIATVGIILAGGEDEAPIATTPQIEEPELVPTTEPVPSTEPEATAESTVPTTEPEPGPQLGVTGLPIFTGEPPAGDYEAISDNLHITFTSDGQWRDCVKEWCDWRGGIEFRPSEKLLHAYGWIEPTPHTAGEFRDIFAATPGLVVGPLETLAPASPDAEWTGATFMVDVEPDAGHDTCAPYLPGPVEFPCVAVAELDGLLTEAALPPVAGVWIVHGPTQVHVLTRPDGRNVWASVLWFAFPEAPEGKYEEMNQQMNELVETIKFVD